MRRSMGTRALTNGWSLLGGPNTMELQLTIARTRLLAGFDDPTVGPERWDALLDRGDTVFMSLNWLSQSRWWEHAHWGKRLLLIAAELDGQLVAVAPLASTRG